MQKHPDHWQHRVSTIGDQAVVCLPGGVIRGFCCDLHEKLARTLAGISANGSYRLCQHQQTPHRLPLILLKKYSNLSDTQK